VVSSFEPSCNRFPSILRSLKKLLAKGSNSILVFLPSAEDVVHVPRVAIPISWNHVNQTSTTISRLIYGGVVTSFVRNLRESLVDDVAILAFIDLWTAHHCIEGIDPVLCAIMSKFVTSRSGVGFGLAWIAFWPPSRFVVNARKHLFRDANGVASRGGSRGRRGGRTRGRRGGHTIARRRAQLGEASLTSRTFRISARRTCSATFPVCVSPVSATPRSSHQEARRRGWSAGRGSLRGAGTSA